MQKQINIAEITMPMTRYKVSPIIVHRRKAWWKAEFFFGLGCVGLMRVVEFPEEVVACSIILTLSILLFSSFNFLCFRINSTHSSFAPDKNQQYFFFDRKILELDLWGASPISKFGEVRYQNFAWIQVKMIWGGFKPQIIAKYSKI